MGYIAIVSSQSEQLSSWQRFKPPHSPCFNCNSATSAPQPGSRNSSHFTIDGMNWVWKKKEKKKKKGRASNVTSGHNSIYGKMDE